MTQGQVSTGSAVAVSGELVESPGGKQKFELKATEIKVVGKCDSTYPLQKKRHSLEYLRTIGHLRPRTNLIGAVTRVRNALSFATHSFFQVAYTFLCWIEKLQREKGKERKKEYVYDY